MGYTMAFVATFILVLILGARIYYKHKNIKHLFWNLNEE